MYHLYPPRELKTPTDYLNIAQHSKHIIKIISIFFALFYVTSVFAITNNSLHSTQPNIRNDSLMIGEDCIANCENAIEKIILPKPPEQIAIAETAWDIVSVVIDLGTIAFGFATSNPVMVSDGLVSLSLSGAAFLMPGVPAGLQHYPKVANAMTNLVSAARTYSDFRYLPSGLDFNNIRFMTNSVLQMMNDVPLIQNAVKGIERHSEFVNRFGSNISSGFMNWWENNIFNQMRRVMGY